MRTATARSGIAEASEIRGRNRGSARLPPRPYGVTFADTGGLTIGHADDPAELEADKLAEQAMAGVPLMRPSRVAPTIQRMCAACEEAQEKNIVRRKAGGGHDVHGGLAAPPAVSSLLSKPGKSLDPAARSYFESRFGRSFDDVAIHDGSAADDAARSIGARAFTAGSSIAFASGQYAPNTQGGLRLLAHELAHVEQQRSGAGVVRRATYATGTRPNSNWTPVPANERAHVDEALAKIDAVVADPVTYRECHEQYATKCPNGNQRTLATIWNRARIWRVPGPPGDVYAWAPTGGSDIGYTSLGYSQNATDLAATIMHEAGHNCGIPGGDTHWHAELVSNYCMTAGQNSFSLSVGPSLTGGEPTFLLSYRRFLGDWAGGRLRATLGADWNMLGTVSEAADVRPPAERPPHEFGSVSSGFQIRAGGWGGTRYGGISFRFETGIGAGRFALGPTTSGGPSPTGIMPDIILQVGPRAEFLIRWDNAHVVPLSIGAAYRYVQPLNADARALHAGLLSAGVSF